MLELARHLRIDSVSRVVAAEAHTIAEDVSIGAAVARLQEERSGCLLVTRGEQLIGIFTERDLLKRVLSVSKPLDAPLSDVMTSPAVSVTLKEPLHLAIRTMEEGGYRHLPIVDRQGRPVGVLTVGRIVHYLVEHFPGTIYNQPPEPHRYPEAPEGA